MLAFGLLPSGFGVAVGELHRHKLYRASAMKSDAKADSGKNEEAGAAEEVTLARVLFHNTAAVCVRVGIERRVSRTGALVNQLVL